MPLSNILMMKKRNRLFIALVAMTLIVAMLSCRKRDKYPDEPYLEFRSLTKIDNGTPIDNEALLTTYFTDGKGNIGAIGDDTAKNFFITYYELQNGTWVAPEEFAESFHVCLPQMLPSGIEEALDGEIELKININNPYSTFDTIRFECYVKDRNNLKSNIITTDSLIIKKK